MITAAKGAAPLTGTAPERRTGCGLRTNDSSAQVAFVICGQCMRRMALTCQAAGQAHIHFTVNAGYKAVNFQIIDAQSELVCLILFHKIEFLECERLLILGFRHYPRLQSYF